MLKLTCRGHLQRRGAARNQYGGPGRYSAGFGGFLPGQCTNNLNGIGALLQPDDLAALQGPNVSEAGGDLFPGSPRPAGVAPQGDDAVAGLEELGAHGDEALEVLEKTAEEVAEHVVEPEVDTAVREAFDYFAPDVRRQHQLEDVGVTPRFVEPTDDSYLGRIRHESPLKFGAPPHPASDKRPNAKAKLPGPPATVNFGKPGWRPRSASAAGYAASFIDRQYGIA